MTMIWNQGLDAYSFGIRVHFSTKASTDIFYVSVNKMVLIACGPYLREPDSRSMRVAAQELKSPR